MVNEKQNYSRSGTTTGGCPVDHSKHNYTKDGSLDNPSASKCPVDHTHTNPITTTTSTTSTASTTSTTSWNPISWFTTQQSAQKSAPPPNPTSGCPVKHDNKNKNTKHPSSSSSSSSCPIKHDSQNTRHPFASFSLPASIEESSRHAQTPHPDQRIPLSTRRVVSTIPRADELQPQNQQPQNQQQPQPQPQPPIPHHQPKSSSQWVYPSEQQFYNAMKRKGWSHVDETTIPFVVKIHNAVNERGWTQVCKWEHQLYHNQSPRLVRFLGRPQDMSPKAFLNTYLWQYNPPFDRHDWFVDRGDGKEPRRYVIDFYTGNDQQQQQQQQQQPASSLITSLFQNRQDNNNTQQTTDDASTLPLPPRPPAMYLDVRPAIDSPEVFLDRCKMFFMETFPGINEAMKQQQSSNDNNNNNNNNNNNLSTTNNGANMNTNTNTNTNTNVSATSTKHDTHNKNNRESRN